MSDKIKDNTSSENANDGDSASEIFAAILREAAEKAMSKDTSELEPDLPLSLGGSDSRDRAKKQVFSLKEQEDLSKEESTGPSAGGRHNAAEPIGDNAQTEPPEKPQRFLRIPRGPRQKSRRRSGLVGGYMNTFFVVLISAGLVATLLTWFTDPQFLNPAVVRGLQLNDPMLLANMAGSGATPTPVATPNWHYRIGIISGHRGNDSGAICLDEYGNVELLEVDINFAVAQRVVAKLKAENFAVDLLDENDPRLENYQADALVSIHANTCMDFGEVVSSFIVAKAEAKPDFGVDTLLRECVAINYGALVPLERSYVTTLHMTDYNVFGILHPLTPAVILEMGYMLADRDILVNEPELLAQAITNGIYCYLGVSGDVLNLSPARAGSRYLVPILETPTPEWSR